MRLGYELSHRPVILEIVNPSHPGIVLEPRGGGDGGVNKRLKTVSQVQ